MLIADTGRFHLTLSEDQIDSTVDGDCYYIKNLKTKVYLGTTSLSSTPNTEFKLIFQEFPQVNTTTLGPSVISNYLLLYSFIL